MTSNGHKSIEILKTTKIVLSPIDELKLIVLVEDSSNLSNPNLMAKHGLSFFLESKIMSITSRIISDVGPAPDIALRNAESLGLDVRKSDSIFITHGHYDHVGALSEFLKFIDRPIPVISHPDIIDQKIAFRPKLMPIGMDSKQLEIWFDYFIFTRKPFEISKGVMTSGEIVRSTDFEDVKGLWKIKDNLFTKDNLLEEQSLIINIRNKGLMILIGCSHPGVINIIRHAQQITGIKKIHAVVGGMHLLKADRNKILKVIKELLTLDFDFIHPCHCTGTKTINLFMNFFEDRCVPIQTGSIIKF